MLTFALSSALAARTTWLDVTVVDAETGAPLREAQLLFAGSSERHTVNGETGRWSCDLLYLSDGTEQVFGVGTALSLLVVAPGYRPAEVHHVVARRGRERIRVAARPLAWAPGEGAPAIEQRVHDEYVAWEARTAELAADRGSDEARAARETARERVATLAEDWLAWVRETGADPATAEAVCRSTARHPERCAP